MPTPTTEQRVEFAIRCGMLVYQDKAWTKWATDWLEGKDRSDRAACAAADAADAARVIYAADAACTAAYAACTAAYAAAYDGKFSRDLNRIAKKVMKGN